MNYCASYNLTVLTKLDKILIVKANKPLPILIFYNCQLKVNQNWAQNVLQFKSIVSSIVMILPKSKVGRLCSIAPGGFKVGAKRVFLNGPIFKTPYLWRPGETFVWSSLGTTGLSTEQVSAIISSLKKQSECKKQLKILCIEALKSCEMNPSLLCESPRASIT